MTPLHNHTRKGKVAYPKSEPIIEKVTPKGNRLIEFTRVSDEERKRLRIDSYKYII